MNCDETFAFFYAVADAFVEFEADGVIDSVFLFFAAAAEHGKSRAKLFAIRCGNEAGGRTCDIGIESGLAEEVADRQRRVHRRPGDECPA